MGKKITILYSVSFALVLLMVIVIVPCHADTVSWVNWTSDPTTTYTRNGRVEGIITDSEVEISVTYTGEILFTQTALGGGPGYPVWDPASTFTSSTILNAPPEHIIALLGGRDAYNRKIVNTLTFSQPVMNAILAIYSLGQTNVERGYGFSNEQPFDIITSGPSSAWGGGFLSQNNFLDHTDLAGREGNGLVQFTGTFSTLSWTVTDYENWSGFTVGVPSAVPEPSTMLLFVSGLVCLASLRKRLIG